MKELLVLNKYFWKYRGRLFLGFIFIIISNWFRIKQPQLVRDAMDSVVTDIQRYKTASDAAQQAAIAETLSTNLSYFGILVLVCAILMGVFMFFMRQSIIVMSRLIEYDQRNELFKHYEILSSSFYKRSKVGDLMSRIVEDVNKVRNYLGPTIMYFINTISLFVMTITAMLQVNAKLTLFALLPLPVLSFVIYYVSSRVSKRSIAISKQMSALTTIAQESYSGVRLIKTYTQEEAIGEQFSAASDDFKEKTLSLARLQAVSGGAVVLLMGLSTILTIYIGGRLAIENKITFGNIAEFVIYVGMLAWPVIALGWMASSAQQSAASQKRINEFLQTKSDIMDSPNPVILPSVVGDIEFKNVSFRYPDTGIEALKNISFSVKKGEKLAILGKTGSGKTSIADLLCRLYDPVSGEIRLDGHPLPQIQLASLRESIAYVPQDVFLFSDTIANNIAFGVKESHIDTIQEYARYAAIHNELLELPQGYDTIVGERGVMLSGGQKQRISLARAFIRQSPIIVLDDCLSAVDANTEQQILHYLDTVLQGKTTLLITHRVHYLKDFDYIIVLDEGRIVEQGKHNDLLKMGGYYADLYQLQQADS